MVIVFKYRGYQEIEEDDNYLMNNRSENIKKICFVHGFKIADNEHLEFLGNIPTRTSRLLGENAVIHFLFEGNARSEKLINNGIKIHRYGLAGSGLLFEIFNKIILIYSVYKICKREQIDVVLNLSNHYYFFLICIGAKLAGSKCVARVVGIIPETRDMPLKRKLVKRIGKLLEQLSLYLADRVLSVSNFLKEELIKRGNRADKIWVISQGVDVGFLKPREMSKVSETPKVLLFVGRILITKGVEDAISAFLRVRKEYSDIEFVICGEGPEKENMINKFGGEANLIFKGFMPFEKLADVYNSADIFIFPSYYEGLPNVVLEAMASRIPVIATTVGEIPILLNDGRGILVKPGDVDRLSEATIKMMDEKYRVECVQKAYAYVLENHSFDVVRNLTMQLFNFN